eukprot:2549687-Lingulodinium_polyedra.AAC.1
MGVFRPATSQHPQAVGLSRGQGRHWQDGAARAERRWQHSGQGKQQQRWPYGCWQKLQNCAAGGRTHGRHSGRAGP